MCVCEEVIKLTSRVDVWVSLHFEDPESKSISDPDNGPVVIISL